jgi:hypothetical protein
MKRKSIDHNQSIAQKLTAVRSKQKKSRTVMTLLLDRILLTNQRIAQLICSYILDSRNRHNSHSNER